MLQTFKSVAKDAVERAVANATTNGTANGTVVDLNSLFEAFEHLLDFSLCQHPVETNTTECINLQSGYSSLLVVYIVISVCLKLTMIAVCVLFFSLLSFLTTVCDYDWYAILTKEKEHWL